MLISSFCVCFFFQKNASSTLCSVLSNEEAKLLTASFSFGYGLVQIALSVIPVTLLKFCEIIGFHVNKEVGLSSLMISSNSNDMKSPIARCFFFFCSLSIL